MTVDARRRRDHTLDVSDAPLPTRATAALATLDLEKRYPDGSREVVAVRGVTVSIDAGSFTVLRGASGSGKTTLLSLLGGMTAPTKGDVLVHGRSIVHLRDRHRSALRRDDVGFVFQELSLVPELSVEENVLLPLVPRGGAGPEDLARLTARLERLGLAKHRRTITRKLSGGERQRVAILRALTTDPPVLLLDEPSAHLDASSTRDLLVWLDALVSEPLTSVRGEAWPSRRTLVVTSHDPRVIEHDGVDRVLSMEDGALVDDVRRERPRTAEARA